MLLIYTGLCAQGACLYIIQILTGSHIDMRHGADNFIRLVHNFWDVQQ